MRNWIIALALLFGVVAWADPASSNEASATSIEAAQDPRSGMPMVYEIPPQGANIVLAGLIGESLRRDPTGNGYVRGTPCLTPNHLFNAIRRAHPSVAPASVEGLSAFLRSLVLRRARSEGFTGSYQMSRMLCERPDTSRPGDEVDWNHTTREFRLEEYAWFHPNQAAPIMAGDCGNVLLALVPPRIPSVKPCPQIRVNVRPGDRSLQFIQLGRRMPSDPNCPFLYKGPGDTEFYGLPTACPHGPCDFTQVIRASRLVGGPSGGMDVSTEPGEYIFQVSEAWMMSQEHLYVFCLSRADEESCGKDIGKADYFDGIAVAGYAQSDVPDGWGGTIRIWCFVADPRLCGTCH